MKEANNIDISRITNDIIKKSELFNLYVTSIKDKISAFESLLPEINKFFSDCEDVKFFNFYSYAKLGEADADKKVTLGHGSLLIPKKKKNANLFISKLFDQKIDGEYDSYKKQFYTSNFIINIRIAKYNIKVNEPIEIGITIQNI